MVADGGDVRSGETKGIGKRVSLPRVAGCGGGLDGALVGTKVLRCSCNSSPELTPTVVGVGRGRSARFGGQQITKRCQLEVRAEEKENRTEEEVRGILVTPGTGPLADGGRRTASSSAAAWGHYLRGEEGENEEEREGYKRRMVVLPLALA